VDYELFHSPFFIFIAPEGNVMHSPSLSEREAAKFLGLAVQSLRNRRCQRKSPPYLKIGSRVVYLVRDLEEFQRAHRIDPEKWESGSIDHETRPEA
jgi:hypothetical protein